MLETLWQDLRFGAWMLRKNPGVTALIALSLILGIAANTTIFSVVNALLIAPPPVERPDELWQVWLANLQSSSAMKRHRTMTYPSLQFLREHQQSFQALGAMNIEPQTVTWNHDGTGVAVQCQTVTGNYFELCGVQAERGRTFAPDEDRTSGTHPVTLVSHEFWQQKLGARPDVIGQPMTINGTALTIIGVAPPRFTGAIGVVAPDIWIPFAMAPTIFREPELLTNHGRNAYVGLGRVKPGVTTAQAEAELNSLMQRLAEAQPNPNQTLRIGLQPSLAVPAHARGMIAGFTGILMAAVMFVLLIACANAANLLLARAATRRAEMAVRAALGATRLRIAMQLLAESLVLGAAGGLAGVALAAALLEIGLPLVGALPFTADVTLDRRVFAFATGAALVVAIVVGMLPAIRMSTVSEVATLNDASRGSSRANDRARRLIVGVEVAVSVMLICGALLLFKSLARMQRVDIGARIDRVVTMAIDLPWARYPSGHYWAAFYPLLMERVKAIPGVESASISGDVPLEGTGGENLRLPGGDERLLVRFKRADADYFATMGIPVLSGRGFTDGDRIGSPYITVINEALARRLESRFGMKDPLGRALDLPALGFGPDQRATMTIVGIIGNERVRSDLRVPPDEIAYVPIAQAPRMRVKLSVRTLGGAAAVVPAIRGALDEIDPLLAIADIRTLEDIWRRSLSDLVEPVWMIGLFAAVAALLAGIGLYGVVANSVAQQRREIGIRMALGARSADVLSLISRHVLATIAAGLAIGLAAAAALTRVMRSLLFEVSALDPAAFATAAVAMALIGTVAALIPAARATRVDPTVALRSE